MGSDTFVTPMAPDLFSLYALENITSWFERWLSEYDHGRGHAQAELTSIGYDLVLPDPLPIQHGFAGYTVQQYVSRSSGGEIRQTEAYEQHRREIPERARALPPGHPGRHCLGLSNSRMEALNSKVRLLSHRSFGFHGPQPLIAVIYLCCTGLTPRLPLR